MMLWCRPLRGSVAGQALPRIRLRFVPQTWHLALAMRRPFVSTPLPVASRFSLHFTQSKSPVYVSPVSTDSAICLCLLFRSNRCVRHRTRVTLDQPEHNPVHWTDISVLKFGSSTLRHPPRRPTRTCQTSGMTPSDLAREVAGCPRTPGLARPRAQLDAPESCIFPDS